MILKLKQLKDKTNKNIINQFIIKKDDYSVSEFR